MTDDVQPTGLTETERDIKAVAVALYSTGANPGDGVSYADLAVAAIEALDLAARRAEWAKPLQTLADDLTDEEAEKVDFAMGEHMYGHQVSNSYAGMACNVDCRTRALAQSVNALLRARLRAVLAADNNTEDAT